MTFTVSVKARIAPRETKFSPHNSCHGKKAGGQRFLLLGAQFEIIAVRIYYIHSQTPN